MTPLRFDPATAVPVLARTPTVLDTLLRDLPPASTTTEAAGPWRQYLRILRPG